MSVYAQVDPNSNIENTISQTKSAENLPTPVLQEKEIEVSNGTGYSLNNIQGAETVKALEQGTIVVMIMEIAGIMSRQTTILEEQPQKHR